MSVKQGGQSESRCSRLAQTDKGQFPIWFKGIPPERVGLNGEYDYYGLAKRVQCYLCEVLDRRLMQALKVGQRGRVIVLSGALPSGEMLQELTQLVASVPGVDMVEAQAVRVGAELLISA